MSVAHLLEDFGSLTKGSVIEISEVVLEEQRLAAFENGYQAGWDDSAKASSESQGTLTSEAAQGLADLSFTYQEAYSGVINGMRPLIEQIISSILPSLAQQTLAPRITEILVDLLKTHGQAPVELVVANGVAASLGDMLSEHTSLSISVTEDPELGAAQAQLRFGQVCEQDVDLEAVISEISASMDTFFENENHSEREIA